MLTVLVVEDSPSQRECLAQQLTWRGIDTVQAADGVEALDRASDRRLDAILLDLVLPNLDGYAAGRLLKAHPHTQHVPIVTLTSDVRAIALHWSTKHAQAHVTKPWQPRELLATLAQVTSANAIDPVPPSAIAWTEYGVLLHQQANLYRQRRSAVDRYGLKVMRLYDFALTAFETALRERPGDDWTRTCREACDRDRHVWQQQLAQQRPCSTCSYFHGRDDIHCAPHPQQRPGALCPDWLLLER